VRPISEIAERVDAGQIVTREEAEAMVRASSRRCRGPLLAEAREITTRLLSDGALDKARALDTNARTPCGQDVNDLILASPLDGAERVITCPRCGTTMSYRPPRIRIED